MAGAAPRRSRGQLAARRQAGEAQGHRPAAITALPRITEAAPLEDRWVRLRFTDGLVQDVNLAPVFERGGVFSAIRDDRSVFEQVRVNTASGTVEWPGEIDLDPDVLYGTDEPADDRPLERRIVETAR
jgi:hypothetical protein